MVFFGEISSEPAAHMLALQICSVLSVRFEQKQVLIASGGVEKGSATAANHHGIVQMTSDLCWEEMAHGSTLSLIALVSLGLQERLTYRIFLAW